MRAAWKQLASAGALCLAGACGSQTQHSSNPNQGGVQFKGGSTALTSGTASPICYSATIQVSTVNADGSLTAFGSPQILAATSSGSGVVQAVLPCDATGGSAQAVISMTLDQPPDDCNGNVYTVLEGSGPFSAAQQVKCFPPAEGEEADVDLSLSFNVISESVGDVDITASVDVNEIDESMKIPDCKPFLDDGDTNSINAGLALGSSADDALASPGGLFDLRNAQRTDPVTSATTQVSPGESDVWLSDVTGSLYSYTSSIAMVANSGDQTTTKLVGGVAFFDPPSSATGPDGASDGQFVENIPMAVTSLTVNDDGSCASTMTMEGRGSARMKSAWIGASGPAYTHATARGNGFKLTCDCGGRNMDIVGTCGQDNPWNCYPGGEIAAAQFCSGACGATIDPSDPDNTACDASNGASCPNPVQGGLAFAANLGSVQVDDGSGDLVQTMNVLASIDASMFTPIFDTTTSSYTFGAGEEVVEVLNCSNNAVGAAGGKRLALRSAMSFDATARSGSGASFVDGAELGIVTFSAAGGFNYYTAAISSDDGTVDFEPADESVLDCLATGQPAAGGPTPLPAPQ